MKTFKSILGYSAAILTVVLAAITPFVLLGGFTNAIGAMGLSIHPTFSGGTLASVQQGPGYVIQVYKPVGRTTPLQRVKPFIQMVWAPATALPASVENSVDLNADGVADVQVSFKPADLAADVKPLNPNYHAVHIVGIESFDTLVARVNDKIVVRLPLE